MEIAATPMPQAYNNKLVSLSLCSPSKTTLPRINIVLTTTLKTGLDPLQRLWKDLTSAVPCLCSEMPELQIL